jgi:hypothetical protein
MPRQAKSLDVMLAEVNKQAPHRSKVSDGGLGDTAHSSRVSDHNPNSAGVWRARDVTNDPTGGMPGQKLSRLVAAKLGKHPALMSGAYVIFNHQIISCDRLREGWRRYTGINAHEHHVHVSVSTKASGYDSTKPWNLFAPAAPKLNHVEIAQELGIQLVAELRKTPKDREAARDMADDIEARLKKGPES